MPVSPTASTIAEVDSRAASYLTWSRWFSRSADTASRPASGLSRRSRIVTSSPQSMPSTRKTASAWSSQTVQAGVVGTRKWGRSVLHLGQGRVQLAVIRLVPGVVEDFLVADGPVVPDHEHRAFGDAAQPD